MGNAACERTVEWADEAPTIEERSGDYCLSVRSRGCITAFLLDPDALVGLMGNASQAYVNRLARGEPGQIIKLRR